MIIPALLFSFALIMCLISSFYCCRRARSHIAANDNACTQRIDEALTLLQLLQKHRGLGAQQSSVAVAQRTQIARDIDHRWQSGDNAMAELNYLKKQWIDLKQQPADFEAHSRIIKDLLGFIEILSLRVDGPAIELRVAFAERCRSLEDLAKLRGLSTRAANYPQCPIELRVTLKYLCKNLQGSDFKFDNSALRSAIDEIDQHMLDAHRTTISAARCFELLTPIIDSALDDLRNSIHSLKDTRIDPQLNLAGLSWKQLIQVNRDGSLEHATAV